MAGESGCDSPARRYRGAAMGKRVLLRFVHEALVANSWRVCECSGDGKKGRCGRDTPCSEVYKPGWDANPGRSSKGSIGPNRIHTHTHTHTHNEATIHLAHTLRTTGYCQCSPPDVCCRCRRRLLELEGVPEHRRPHVSHQAGRPATSSGVSGHWGHP